MCGRFACSLCPKDLRSKLIDSNVTVSEEWEDQGLFYPSFNVGPHKYIPVVRRSNKELVLHTMKSSGKASLILITANKKPINARDDTLSGQSMFDRAKNKGRCIVVAEGFYEWKHLAGGKKIPHYTKRKDGKLMLFAGLYDVTHIDGQPLYTCTIVTTAASSFFEFLHDRMPVILENDSPDVDTWLSDTPWGKEHVQIMHPFKGSLDCYQVTDAVGSTKANSADFVVPVDQLKGSISSFFQNQSMKRERPDDEETLPQEAKKRATPSSKEKEPVETKKTATSGDVKAHDTIKSTEKRAAHSVKKQGGSKITSFFKKN